ncbi:PHP domain-containing protein [Gorillibacterium sp. CAU 1737]|uniref:PHP domain-containing protein n=1 Tax=Gorillibacterium sp. CAU 1737 TaxID=3140362 RepID=UPI0032605A52
MAVTGSGFADLHTHTTASDGLHAPEENVRMAAQAGLSAIAITDHDTVAGLEAALAEGERLGIQVVPGVEISTVAGGQDIHVLGYYMDYKDDRFRKRLEELRSVRERRNEMMIARFNELGLPITLGEVAEIKARRGGKPEENIGRPHFADWLIEHGHAESLKDAFDRYLGKGGQAYVNPPRIHPSTAIEWIHEAGGSAVLAHPGLYGDEALVDELIQAGLDGIEAMHSDHSPEEEALYRRKAEDAHLLITAGSDFHGERLGETFHGPIGHRRIGIEVLEPLQERGRGSRS